MSSEQDKTDNRADKPESSVTSDAPVGDVADKNPGVFTRRSFITVAIGSAALFAIGGEVKAFGGDRNLLRPPGSQDVDGLLSRCIRCYRCSSVCPLHAIRLAKLEDGIINARTPKMDFRKGYCDFCGGKPKCAESCPTDCFSSFDPMREKIGIATVDTEQCLLYHGSARCSKRCLDVCKYDALILDESGLLKVVQEKCNGCGACEYVCPTGSYQSYQGSPNRGLNIVAVAMERDA